MSMVNTQVYDQQLITVTGSASQNDFTDGRLNITIDSEGSGLCNFYTLS